jgi:hypothetical protein
LRFIFSKLDVALLELTDELLRVWVAEALVTRAAVSTAITDPTFIDRNRLGHHRHHRGAVATANTGEGVLNGRPGRRPRPAAARPSRLRAATRVSSTACASSSPMAR